MRQNFESEPVLQSLRQNGMSYTFINIIKVKSSCSKDFVMYVGGSVWALDWCPQVHENPNSLVKCEVLPYFSPLKS